MRTTSPAFIVLIPSLHPDHHLVDLVKQLHHSRLLNVVIIDDGSGSEYQPLFDQLIAIGAEVIHHPTNQGKGRALKTGFQYVLQHYPKVLGVVTADADGQHLPEDIIKLGNSLLSKTPRMVLGIRDFALQHVPLRSRLGNWITASVFHYLTDYQIQDTQTGCRAISQSLLNTSLSIEGERFEYEMNVLMAFVQRRIPIHQLTIQTVYRDQNKHSHFRSWDDSVMIYHQLQKALTRQSWIRMISSLLDYLILSVVFSLWMLAPWTVFVATLSTRIVTQLGYYVGVAILTRAPLQWKSLSSVTTIIECGKAVLTSTFTALCSFLVVPIIPLKLVFDFILHVAGFQLYVRTHTPSNP